MTVREYIGARYVPMFSDPIEWDGTLVYEPLTVVKHLGASYVSRQSVPAGIAIDNEDYWLLWADYSAQLEAYRNTVLTFDGRITANSDAIADFNEELGTFENTTNGEIAAIKANNWVTTARIADNAVTSAKIANGAVTTDDLANNAVTPAKIADNAVTPSKLADSVIYAPDYILIGDSWGQGWTPDGTVTSWTTKLSAYLSKNGSNVYTRSTGGAGIVAGTNYLSILTTLAETISSSDKKKIGHIICAGGWNDNNTTAQSEYSAKMADMIAFVESNFPHARLSIIWIGTGNYAITGIHPQILRMRTAITAAFNAARGLNLEFVDAANLLCSAGGWASDGYHPAEFQQNLIFAYMKNFVNGHLTTMNILTGGIPIIYGDVESSASIQLRDNPMTVGVYKVPEFYLTGQIGNINKPVTLNGNTPAVSLTLKSVTQAGVFAMNPQIDWMQNAILNIDGKFYACTGVFHMLNSTDELTISVYFIGTNAENTNYLTGTLNQIEFL